MDRPSFTIMALPRGPIWIIEKHNPQNLGPFTQHSNGSIFGPVNGLFTPVFYFEKVVPE